ncbi:MAG: DUF2726 domain-containing protein [Zoogloeaceae bacterium]|nr:DUF2726 domain-containing protein [Zoogloeaceae bacterium]
MEMSNVILIALILAAVAFLALVATLVAKKSPDKQSLEIDNQSEYAPKHVMSQVEQALFLRLIEALPEYLILAQVQMSSFLYDKNKKGGWSALNQIRMKSVDFLVIQEDASTVMAIELQDSTHKRKDRQKSDEFKRDALKTAGIKLLEFYAGKLPSAKEIRAAIGKE